MLNTLLSESAVSLSNFRFTGDKNDGKIIGYRKVNAPAMGFTPERKSMDLSLYVEEKP